jgi:hypothetical protein
LGLPSVLLSTLRSGAGPRSVLIHAFIRALTCALIRTWGLSGALSGAVSGAASGAVSGTLSQALGYPSGIPLRIRLTRSLKFCLCFCLSWGLGFSVVAVAHCLGLRGRGP